MKFYEHWNCPHLNVGTLVSLQDSAVDGDLEAGSYSAAAAVPEHGQDMTQFFEEVNDIKNSMTEIRRRFQKLQVCAFNFFSIF